MSLQLNFFKTHGLLGLAIIIVGCSADTGVYVAVDERIGALPEAVLSPIDNPISPEKIALGRALFWDPILSGNFDVACASCHHPDHGWGDGRQRSMGVGGIGLAEDRFGGAVVSRNANTIINAAFNGIDASGFYDPSTAVMFWDNRHMSLEAQSLEPIASKDEMRGNAYEAEEAISTVSQRLAANDQYQLIFDVAFGANTTINGDKIGKALASYERSIIANNSRFDYYARGNTNALTDLEVRGMNAFIQMNCTACHGGPMFSNYELHDLGVPDNGFEDAGVDGAFRTPTLRNLPLTGPYFHNGAFTTLEEAVNFYDVFEQNDEAAESLNFDENMTPAVVAFLRALNDNNFDKTIPENVPSGLPVGGTIVN